MAFLDELGKTITDKGREAAQKAMEVAEILQIKAQVSNEKSKLNQLYAAVGKIYIERYQENAEDAFKDLYTEIHNVLANIRALEEKIRELDGSKLCSTCGASTEREAMYCSKCGSSVAEPERGMAVIQNSVFVREYAETVGSEIAENLDAVAENTAKMAEIVEDEVD